jgi:subtilisin family serine protease
MKRLLVLLWSVALLLGLLPSTGIANSANPDTIPDSYIVVLESGAPSHVAAEHSQRYNARVTYVYTHALRGYAARMSATAAAGVSRDPRVAYVEQDGVVTTQQTQENATWGLDRIDQRALPLNQSYTYTATGGGVTAYIIDTGIRTAHSEFAGRMVAGYTAIADGRGTDDCNGHGTHVAGTVGGTTYGAAKGVRLAPVRVLDCNGSGTWSGVIAGVDWVTKSHSKPAVANMSLSGGANTAVDNAVRNSVAAGVTYAVAAGNGNQGGVAQDACKYSPARVAEALTIGATTNTDTKTSWSNYGDCVQLFAPGAGITSAWNTDNTATRTISGTSMATPHVTGVAALYLQGNSGAAPKQVGEAILATSTKNVVTSSGTANNHLVYSLLTGGETVNAAPTASFTYACEGLTCLFTDTSSDSDGSVTAWAWAFGDGATSSNQHPSNTYAQAGTYTVTLTVTDNGGATGRASESVTVADTSDSPTVTLGGSSYLLNRNFWRARVAVTTSPAVTVAGTFEPGGTGSCTTNSAGSCVIESGNLSTSKVPSTTFTLSGGWRCTPSSCQVTIVQP